MKVMLISLLVMFSTKAFCGNVVTNPSSSDTNNISASAGVIPLTVNGDSGYDDALDVNDSANGIGLNAETTGGMAVAAVSASSFGIFASSYSSTSAYFSSGTSANTAPTLVVQSVDGSADLVQIQDDMGSPLLSVDSSGALHANAGLQLPSSGSCDSAHRGAMKVVLGGTGVADQLQVCLKNAGGTSSWVTK